MIRKSSHRRPKVLWGNSRSYIALGHSLGRWVISVCNISFWPVVPLLWCNLCRPQQTWKFATSGPESIHGNLIATSLIAISNILMWPIRFPSYLSPEPSAVCSSQPAWLHIYGPEPTTWSFWLLQIPERSLEQSSTLPLWLPEAGWCNPEGQASSLSHGEPQCSGDQSRKWASK